MSADLFAEFGNPNTLRNAAKEPSASITGSSNSAGVHPQPRGSTADANRNATLIDFAAEEPQWQPSSFSHAPQNNQTQTTGINEVLFDASTDFASVEGSEDEWGEFESAKTDLIDEELEEPRQQSVQKKPETESTKRPSVTAPKSHAPPLLDLLSIDDTNPPPKPPRSPLALETKIPARTPQEEPDPVTAWPDFEEGENDWGDFNDSVVVETQKSKSPKRMKTVTAPAPTARFTSPRQTSISNTVTKTSSPAVQPSHKTKAVRPTNIPPPSILLRLFPPLLENLRREASDHAARSKGKAGLPPDPDLSEKIVYSLKVMVHIIAGRSLRWKRDPILSQSTKIGPASGRSGGMKLSSINKNENVKEEKEAVEVLELWSKCNGLMNSAVIAAGGQPVQFIPGNLRVNVATAQEGAIKATHACALCGLRRDERVVKADECVDDMFEEWWTEHWGHSHCRRFWEANSMNLDQR